MGLFSRKPHIDPQELVALRQEFSDLNVRMEATERAKTDLEVQLQQLDAATAGLAARSHMIDEVTARLAEVDVLKRQVAQIDVVNAKVQSLDGLNAKLADLADRVVASADDAKQAKQQTAALQERISNVTTELANQLGELSSELDSLAASKASDAEHVVAEQPMSTEAIDQVKSAQVRLANEQARYEIAFRQDLASLAEQIKRGRS
ncbi:MAG: hypothetical protein ABIR32_14625 [Ilumatobacteraceae bacterium]